MSEPPEPSRPDPGRSLSGDELARLVDRLSRVEERLRTLEKTLGLRAEKAPTAPPAAGDAARPAPGTTSGPGLRHAAASSPPGPDRRTLSGTPAPSMSGVSPAGAPTAAGSPGKTERAGDAASLEARIGQIWVSRAGLALVLVALAMFLKWAYDRDLISHEIRTALGLLSGLALLGLGEGAHRRTGSYAQAFTGAGITALYATLFAAYNLYHLLGQGSSFVCMLATTAAAVALAVRHDAPVIAGLGILGGFAVPYMLAAPEPRLEGMLVYYLILQGGLLITIPRLSRQREPLLILSVLAGFVAATLPAGAGTPVRAEVWLLYFLLLSTAVAWLTMRSVQLHPALVQPLLIILGTLPFLAAVMAGPGHRRPLLSIAYVLVVYLVFLVVERRLAAGARGIVPAATAAALLAAGVQRSDAASGWWNIGAVTVISALAVALSARRRRAPSYVVVLIGGPLGLYTLSTLDGTALALDTLIPALLMGIVIASFLLRTRTTPLDIPLPLLGALLAGGYLWGTFEEHGVEHLRGVLMLALAALHAAAAGLAARLRPGDALPRLTLAGLAVVFLTLFFPAQFDTATVTVAWAVEAAALTVIGLRLRETAIWKGAWIVLVAATMRYLLLDTGLAQGDGLRNATPFLNAHSVAVAALTVSSLLMAARLARGTVPISVSRRDQDRLAGAGLAFLIANAVLLLGVSLEIDGFFRRRSAPFLSGSLGTDRPEMEQFVLTAYYAMHSITLVIVGLVRSSRAPRFLGLGLFTATLVKIISIDLSFLDTIYRVLSFLAVGVLLVLASVLYRGYREKLSGPDDPS